MSYSIQSLYDLGFYTMLKYFGVAVLGLILLNILRVYFLDLLNLIFSTVRFLCYSILYYFKKVATPKIKLRVSRSYKGSKLATYKDHLAIFKYASVLYDDPEILYYCKKLESNKNQVESFKMLEDLLKRKLMVKLENTSFEKEYERLSRRLEEATNTTTNIPEVKRYTFVDSLNQTIYSSPNAYYL